MQIILYNKWLYEEFESKIDDKNLDLIWVIGVNELIQSSKYCFIHESMNLINKSWIIKVYDLAFKVLTLYFLKWEKYGNLEAIIFWQKFLIIKTKVKRKIRISNGYGDGTKDIIWVCNDVNIWNKE